MKDDDQLASRKITRTQEMHLEMLRTVRYNCFDGETVVQDLVEWRDLWIAVMGERLPLPLSEQLGKRKGEYIDLCRLRYLQFDRWAVDSLLILTTEDRSKRLMSLIEQRWKADEMEVVDREEADWCMGMQLGDDEVVLYLWWD